MKLTIFGVTCPIGRSLVGQALLHGHQVTAYRQDEQQGVLNAEELRLVTGSLEDDTTLSKALGGVDAVVCILDEEGLQPEEFSDPQHIQSVINEAVSLDVKQVVFTLSPFILKKKVPKGYEEVVREHLAVHDQLQSTPLDWVVVCPWKPALVKSQGKYRTAEGKVPSKSTPVPVSDVAEFLLEVLCGRKHHKKVIGISC